MIDIRDHGGAFGGGNVFDETNMPLQATFGTSFVMTNGQRMVGNMNFHCDDNFIYCFTYNGKNLMKVDKKTGVVVLQVQITTNTISYAVYDELTRKIYLAEKYSDYSACISRINSDDLTVEARSNTYTENALGPIVVDENYVYVTGGSYVRNFNKAFLNYEQPISATSFSLGSSSYTFQHLKNKKMIVALISTGNIELFDLENMVYVGKFTGVGYLTSWYIDENEDTFISSYGTGGFSTKKLALNFLNLTFTQVFSFYTASQTVMAMLYYKQKKKLLLYGGTHSYLLDLKDNTGQLIPYNIMLYTYVLGILNPIEDNKKPILYGLLQYSDSSGQYFHAAYVDADSFK